MPQLTWSKAGERFFETGVDRGVLYVEDQPGVAWNGLTSVAEAPTGAEAQPYYMDGVKFLNYPSVEEFEATISAYFSPPEFDVCDGMEALAEGLYLTAQERTPFSLCYRTNVGNDVDGAKHGYKIHIIYNALAAPSEHENSSIGEGVDPTQLSWKLTTTPRFVADHRPTAHIIIDSTKATSDQMTVIEQNLYGTPATNPTLLTPERLVDLLNEFVVLTIIKLALGKYSAQGFSVTTLSDGKFAIDHTTVSMIGDGLFEVFSEGESYTLSVETPNSTEYAVEGDNVEMVSGEIFAMDDDSIVDNGNGTLTIL